MNSRALRAGIDLGGTKIAGVVLDASGIEVCRERVATPQGDYQLTLQALVGLVATLEANAGQQCSVGIGMPGSASRATGLVKNSNSVCLNGQPLHRDLEVLLDRPLRFANDADCFALSEAADGAAAGAAWCLLSSLAPVPAVVWWSTGNWCRAPTVLPVSGDTIHCPGRSRMSCRARPVIAAGRAVLRRGYPVPGWLGTISKRTVFPWMR